MANIIYFYVYFIIINIGKSLCDADHVLTSETSFSIFTPWTDPNAVNTVLLQLPKDKKRATSINDLSHGDDQLMIRIRIGPSSNVRPVEKYLVINDIYDPRRQAKDKALVPYLVEIMRGEPIITYSLDYKEDVKYDHYTEQNSHKTKKKHSQPVSPSSPSLEDQDYKPAIERLNAVMKKLSEIFEVDSEKTDVDTVQPKKGRKKSKHSKQPESDVIEDGFQDSNELNSAEKDQHSADRLKNSCSKRNVLENWKNRKLFKENEKSFNNKKRMSSNGQDFNTQTPSEMSIHQNTYNQQATTFIGQNGDIAANFAYDDKPMLSPLQDATSFSSNNRLRRLHRHNRLQKNQEQSSNHDIQPNDDEYQRNMNDQTLGNSDEEEISRAVRAALASHKQNYLKTKPHNLEKRQTSLVMVDSPSNENSHFTKNKSLSGLHNSRSKRSVFDGVSSHRHYKNEDIPDLDQCDRSKIFLENDFDIQACDTCGGKSKKPQKPPPAINDRLAIHKKRATLNEKPMRRHDTNPKAQVCQCRTDHSACICCPGKKLRSQQSPVWFSVFTLNSPTAFVTSRIRIFRKRRGQWWEIAPPTNLNSISGVHSDGNFSFSFSSPVELFQLEKALRLQDQQLLYPVSNGVESVAQNSNELKPESIEINILNLQELNNNPNLLMTTNKKAVIHKKRMPELRPLRDFGFFPTTTNVIEKCPYNDKRLCLNMLTDEAPASTFKVQMPFQENVLVNKHLVRIQISNIITDATTKDAMQISVLAINKGVQSRLVTLSINNCPTGSDSILTEAKTSVEKLLVPNIAETATYLLPLIEQAKTKHKKFECQVVVSTKLSDGRIDRVTRRNQNGDYKVVSKRKFLVESEKRCLCIWHCACHCIPKFVPHSDYNMCQKMSASELRQAGFPKDSAGKGSMSAKDFLTQSSAVNAVYSFIRYALWLLLLMLLLGLIKAILGLCVTAIDRCCYDYVYPNPGYDRSSRLRKFLSNVFIFIIFPFRFLCTCFTPTPEDLLVASSEWQCCKDQSHMCEDEFDEANGLQSAKRTHSKCSSRIHGRLSSGIDVKQQELSKRLSRLSLAFQQEFSDDEYGLNRASKSPIEIVRTLSERRDQRRKSRKHMPSTSASAAKERLANEFVQTLLDAKRVYRTLKEPIGNVSKIPHGVKYCIQGYFLATRDTAYEFVSFQPLVQYRGIAAQTFFIKELHPPIFLSSGAFNRRYANEIAVLKSGDISVQPPEGVPCINVRVIEDDDSTDSDTSSVTSQQ